MGLDYTASFHGHKSVEPGNEATDERGFHGLEEMI
jgi:hypothetical protein